MIDKSLETLLEENNREQFPLTMLPFTAHTKEETAVRAVIDESMGSVSRSVSDRASVAQTMKTAADRRRERIFHEEHKEKPENEIRSLLCVDTIANGEDKDVTDRLSALKTAHPEVYKQQEQSVNLMIQTYLVSRKPAPDSAIMETLAAAADSNLVPSASRDRLQSLKDRAAILRAQGASRLTRNAAKLAEEESKKRSAAAGGGPGRGKRSRGSK